MSDKARTQKKNSTDAGGQPAREMTDTMLKNFQTAMRTGMKLQEEAGRWWSNVLGPATIPDWQKRVANFTALACGLMPAAQRRMEETLDLMEKNSRAGADLARKAAEAAQTPAMVDSQAKWLEFWTSTLRTVQTNLETISEINGRTIDSCIQIVRKNTEADDVGTSRTA